MTSHVTFSASCDQLDMLCEESCDTLNLSTIKFSAPIISTRGRVLLADLTSLIFYCLQYAKTGEEDLVYLNDVSVETKEREESMKSFL